MRAGVTVCDYAAVPSCREGGGRTDGIGGVEGQEGTHKPGPAPTPNHNVLCSFGEPADLAVSARTRFLGCAVVRMCARTRVLPAVMRETLCAQGYSGQIYVLSDKNGWLLITLYTPIPTAYCSD